MCGRFYNNYSWREIYELYRLTCPPDPMPDTWTGRQNIPPTVSVPVVRYAGDCRRVDLMRWGLVPTFAKEIGSFATHNARIETIQESLKTGKGLFGAPWKKGQRCLVPAEAFFEWRKPEKTPFAIGMANRQPFAFGGLWSYAPGVEGGLFSCTIITHPPNKVVEPIHDRMPFIVPEENWAAWLNETPTTPDQAMALVVPLAAERMAAWITDKGCGNVRNAQVDLYGSVTL